MLCHVNAIPLNPTLGYSGKATTRERAERFKQILDESWDTLHDPFAAWN